MSPTSHPGTETKASTFTAVLTELSTDEASLVKNQLHTSKRSSMFITTGLAELLAIDQHLSENSPKSQDP